MLKIYYSSIYFKSIAEGLGWIIQRYNKAVSPNKEIKEIEIVDIISKSNAKSKNIKWIILGLQNAPIIPLGKYIVWSFEQFEIDGPVFDQKFWDSLNGAEDIWDYSKENIKWLKSNKGLEALHLPLGWLPQMKISTPINSWATRENTFAFVGLMNERRRDILKPCHELAKANQWNMYLSNKCWGSEYETIYSMTKFGLNIHFYTGKSVLEVHRIIPLILNGIWVITEKSGDSWYDELFDRLVTWAEPDTFAQVLNELNQLDHKQIEAELETRKRLLIQTCDMYKYFLDGDFVKKLI